MRITLIIQYIVLQWKYVISSFIHVYGSTLATDRSLIRFEIWKRMLGYFSKVKQVCRCNWLESPAHHVIECIATMLESFEKNLNIISRRITPIYRIALWKKLNESMIWPVQNCKMPKFISTSKVFQNFGIFSLFGKNKITSRRTVPKYRLAP